MPKTLVKIRKIIEIEAEGIGEKILKARKEISNRKSLTVICQNVGVSRQYWYDLEKERMQGALSIENLRKIEAELETDFGVEL